MNLSVLLESRMKLFKEIHTIFIALAIWGNLFPCFFPTFH